MFNEATKEDLGFRIEGPDGDGFVWICSDKGRDVWCRNLGTADVVTEKFSSWLSQIDASEHG
jgi:hypothetical protein